MLQKLFNALHKQDKVVAFKSQFKPTDEELEAVMAYILYEEYRVKPMSVQVPGWTTQAVPCKAMFVDATA